MNPPNGWKTYGKAILFLAPPSLAWMLAEVFIMPKLKQLCSDAGGVNSALFTVTDNIVRYGVWAAALFIAALVTLEFLSSSWPRYRAIALGIFVYLCNSAVLVSLFCTLVVFGLIAPVLLRR
jgi:hypothetical protein